MWRSARAAEHNCRAFCASPNIMTKKSNVTQPASPGALKHSPFASLGSKPNLAGAPGAVNSARPVMRSTAVKPPPVKPILASQLRLRHETAGRSGKVVTRLAGLPSENLEAIAARLRKALAAGPRSKEVMCFCSAVLQSARHSG
jgi:hypothetical protein